MSAFDCDTAPSGTTRRRAASSPRKPLRCVAAGAVLACGMLLVSSPSFAQAAPLADLAVRHMANDTLPSVPATAAVPAVGSESPVKARRWQVRKREMDAAIPAIPLTDLVQREELAERDAYTDFKPTDTERVGRKAAAPAGSEARSFPIFDTNTKIFGYWSKSPAPANADSAVITIHGRDRNADQYYSTFASILKNSQGMGFGAASPNTILVAPQFWSTNNDASAYAADELGWADSNAWSAGDGSTHPGVASAVLGAVGAGPAPGAVSAFTVLDALVAHFSNQAAYPKMKYITVVGHGGGGQLVTRYAALGQDNPAANRISLRYVVGDPSSNLAYTKDRPTAVSTLDCPTYDAYRYSLNNYSPGSSYPLPFGGNAAQIFQRFALRDVRFVIGRADTDNQGDQSCMARAWSGQARQERNQAYYKYIWLLSGGDPKAVSTFFGSFPALGTGKNDAVSQSSPQEVAKFKTASPLQAKITFVAGAKHNAKDVYGSSNGKQFLFADASTLTNAKP